MMRMFLKLRPALRDHVCYVAQKCCMVWNKIFRAPLQLCLLMFQKQLCIAGIPLRRVHKLVSYLASGCFYYNKNIAGGKILKGLQNRRLDERALFMS
jgi:hypothetical protein